LQWLLKRKTAPISNTAHDNDYLDRVNTEPYIPNDSNAIDDSSDDEQVINLMLDVDEKSSTKASRASFARSVDYAR
jgi:hypothetical protein